MGDLMFHKAGEAYNQPVIERTTDDAVIVWFGKDEDAERYGNLFAAAEAMADAIPGLLKIAEMAMPDTHYQTDRRVRKAKKALELAGRAVK